MLGLTHKRRVAKGLPLTPNPDRTMEEKIDRDLNEIFGRAEENLSQVILARKNLVANLENYQTQAIDTLDRLDKFYRREFEEAVEAVQRTDKVTSRFERVRNAFHDLFQYKSGEQ